MTRSTPPLEQGFTLIELLIIISILGVLAMISLTSFWVYKNEAEYAKASADLRNARVAIEAGEEDLAGASVAYAESADSGGPLVGSLSTLFPELGTSRDVVLGAQFDPCDASSPAMQINKLIVSKACKAKQIAQYVRFCGGIEVISENVAGTC